MMSSHVPPVGSRVPSQTDAYLETVAACVDLLPQLIDAYSAGEAYQATADDIRRLESECDAYNRELTSLLSNATAEQIGLRNTRLHLNASRLVKMYQNIDDVANTAERIAEELVTIRPPVNDPHLQPFREMADCATSAAAVLETVVSTFAAALSSHDQTISLTEGVTTIRGLESSCDAQRNELIERVFADDTIQHPLVYREFALLFDQLLDAIEDVTDQIVLIASRESWIQVEPPREP